MTGQPSGDAIVREVATAVGLAEGQAGVHDVLGVVGRLGRAPTRTISRATGLPVPIVAAICGELRKRGVVGRERPTRLTPLGRQLFGRGGRRLAFESIEQELGPVMTELAVLAEAAPQARTELDQSHCTVETKLRRALLLRQAGALDGKRVLLLGDDDLTSLAIHGLAVLYGFADTIRELTVIDIDPAVLAYIGKQLRRPAFPMRRVEHDLRLPLPAALIGRFDTVFTDPPYTIEGAELFLSRAAAALEPKVGGSVFLAFGPKPPEDSLRLQAAIAQMGFVIRHILTNFNDYLHAGILGGTSHLYHLTSTASTRSLVSGAHHGHLYTGEKRPARPYRCAS